MRSFTLLVAFAALSVSSAVSFVSAQATSSPPEVGTTLGVSIPTLSSSSETSPPPATLLGIFPSSTESSTSSPPTDVVIDTSLASPTSEPNGATSIPNVFPSSSSSSESSSTSSPTVVENSLPAPNEVGSTSSPIVSLPPGTTLTPTALISQQDITEQHSSTSSHQLMNSTSNGNTTHVPFVKALKGIKDSLGEIQEYIESVSDELNAQYGVKEDEDKDSKVEKSSNELLSTDNASSSSPTYYLDEPIYRDPETGAITSPPPSFWQTPSSLSSSSSATNNSFSSNITGNRRDVQIPISDSSSAAISITGAAIVVIASVVATLL